MPGTCTGGYSYLAGLELTFAGTRTDRVRRVEIDPLRIALGPPILCYVGCVGEWPDWCDWTGGGLSQGGNWTDADRWRCESRILVCGRRGSNMERGVGRSGYCIWENKVGAGNTSAVVGRSKEYECCC